MATYTLSHTGAEVDAAVTNVTNLFTTAHTWTANQTFTNIGVNISQGALSVTSGATLMVTNGSSLEVKPGGSLRVLGASSFSVEGSSGTFTITPAATFQSTVSVTGALSSASLTTTGDVTVGGELYASITASDDLDMEGHDIVGAHDVAVTGFVGGPQLYVQKGQSIVEFVSSGSGIASAPHDGFYIDSDGAITRFRMTGSIPASVLVIYFH